MTTSGSFEMPVQTLATAIKLRELRCSTSELSLPLVIDLVRLYTAWRKQQCKHACCTRTSSALLAHQIVSDLSVVSAAVCAAATRVRRIERKNCKMHRKCALYSTAQDQWKRFLPRNVVLLQKRVKEQAIAHYRHENQLVEECRVCTADNSRRRSAEHGDAALQSLQCR